MVYRVLCMYRIVLSFVFQRMGFNLDTIDPVMACVHLVFFSLSRQLPVARVRFSHSIECGAKIERVTPPPASPRQMTGECNETGHDSERRREREKKREKNVYTKYSLCGARVRFRIYE